MPEFVTNARGSRAWAAVARAPDPDVRASLERIVADEMRHAVLSFRIVAWALHAGGDAVRSAVIAAFGEPGPKLDLRELARRSGVDATTLARGAEQGLRDLLEPARSRLLASGQPRILNPTFGRAARTRRQP